MIAKHFKIFWSLQVRTCVNAYRTLRACQILITQTLYNRKLLLAEAQAKIMLLRFKFILNQSVEQYKYVLTNCRTAIMDTRF